MTWPILRARSSWGSGGNARKASTLCCANSSIGFDIARHPMNVLERVKPDMGCHRTDEDVRIRSQGSPHTDTSSLQVEDAVDALMREQLVAAHMHAAEHLDGFSLIDSNGKCGSELDD